MQRSIDHQTSHAVHHMFEIKFGDAVALEIRRRIQEVDGIRYALLDCKLDGVHFVSKRLVDGLRVAHNALAQLWRKIIVVHEIAALLGIISHGQNIHLAERKATHVFVEIDKFLQRHAIRASAVIGRQQFFLIVYLINVLPSATGIRLQNGGTADNIEQTVPIDWILSNSAGIQN